MDKDSIKEHPILFSGPMVRAILEGRKTMTRRVAHIDGTGPWIGGIMAFHQKSLSKPYKLTESGKFYPAKCPYGQPGDLMWVREAFLVEHHCRYGKDPEPYTVYKADGGYSYCWKPSIFMPRWASRLTLEIVSVRVERLQDISNEDIQAEGTENLHPLGGINTYQWRDQFRFLWDSINAKRGYGWDANPWVWVVEFKRV